MKHFLFYDLPLEKQAALSVITLYDVVTEKGIPNLESHLQVMFTGMEKVVRTTKTLLRT